VLLTNSCSNPCTIDTDGRCIGYIYSTRLYKFCKVLMHPSKFMLVSGKRILTTKPNELFIFCWFVYQWQIPLVIRRCAVGACQKSTHLQSLADIASTILFKFIIIFCVTVEHLY